MKYSQSIAQGINLSTAQVLSHAATFLNENRKYYYEKARIRCASVQQNGEWLNALCLCSAFPKNRVPEKKQSARYKTMHLLESWIPLGELLGYAEATTRGSVAVDNEPIFFCQGLTFRQWDQYEAGNFFSEMTGFVYKGEGSTQVGIPTETLRLPGLRPHSDGSGAIRHWFELDDFDIRTSGHRGSSLIFLPECRAFFESLKLTKDALDVTISRQPDLKWPVHLMAIWKKNSQQVGDLDEKVTRDSMSFDVPEGANGCQLHLVNGEGEPLDQRSASLGQFKLSDGAVSRVDLFQADTALSASEYSQRIPGDDADESPDAHKVFVIHGRNFKLKEDLESFLKSLGLEPIDWLAAIAMTGEPNPYVGDVLNLVFSKASALVVLMTPDDQGRLKEHLWSAHEPNLEKEFRGQARQNVIFEAGMALSRYNKRTILVEIGTLKPFSDTLGRHILKLNNSSEKRKEFIEKLKIAGCELNPEDGKWKDVGDFSSEAADGTSENNKLEGN